MDGKPLKAFTVIAVPMAAGTIEWKSSRTPDVLQETRSAIRFWKADGIIGDLGGPKMERLVRRSRLPAVNFSANARPLFPTVC